MSRSNASRSSGLQQVLEIARDPEKQWSIVIGSRPWTTAAEQLRDNAILRQELRNLGLPYWLLFGEWQERSDLPSVEWSKFVFVDGTGSEDLSAVIRQLMGRHRQRAALICKDGRSTVIRSSGEATELGKIDIRSSVEAYGRSLDGTGTLTLVRAFVPVGVFGATVRRR